METNQQSSFPSFALNTRNGVVEFTSAYATTADAYWALEGKPNLSSFALDLLAAARKRGLSEVQRGWLHKLATDANAPKPVVASLNLIAIVELLQRAADAGKKFPRVQVASVELKRAGAGSKRPGTVAVLFGGEYVGRIALDGSVTEVREPKTVSRYQGQWKDGTFEYEVGRASCRERV